MPTIDHEAPLAVLREEPALVVELLRRALEVELPAFATAAVSEADFTQPLPAEFHADLVIHLRDEAQRPVMGIVVEVQRARDDDKRWTWPLYVCALHARLQRPTCLVVLTSDAGVARWAARSIDSFQPGATFCPLVLGPEQVPRLEPEDAAAAPWVAIVSALVHGAAAGGATAALAGIEGARLLGGERASLFTDLILAQLDDVARRALEVVMETRKYEYKSDFARSYFERGLEEGRQKGREEGREEGREVGREEGLRQALLALVARRAVVSDEQRARIVACADPERLLRLVVEVGAAADDGAVARLLAEL
ncbi:MAG: hypothetical protein HS111_17085 [Kofleriaceae bacterium]|nr:hypothetical protein [Kofleriaceae bacterium]MCL4223116.1 hypothetical protein [Myxococcales bacterium]